jgi:hypothetical protein
VDTLARMATLSRLRKSTGDLIGRETDVQISRVQFLRQSLTNPQVRFEGFAESQSDNEPFDKKTCSFSKWPRKSSLDDS